MQNAERSPLQGVTNILRFNWHFYVIAVLGVAVGLSFASWLGGWWLTLGWCVAALVLATTLVSLLVSWYIYDYAGIYELPFLPADLPPKSSIVNIHAGFDETSALLAERYPDAKLLVLDFYDPQLHTEVSVQRARKAYPAYPGTRAVSTDDLGLDDNSIDAIFLIFAAHEIRDPQERVDFFILLRKALKPDGRIYLTEHLRDGANFLAYSLGAYHFLPRSDWQQTFSNARLRSIEMQKTTPFITSFTLAPHVDSP